MPNSVNLAGYVTVARAAEMLGYDPAHVRRLILNGAVEAVELNPRMKLVSLASLERFDQTYTRRRRRSKRATEGTVSHLTQIAV